jgi:hypothetical protein
VISITISHQKERKDYGAQKIIAGRRGGCRRGNNFTSRDLQYETGGQWRATITMLIATVTVQMRPRSAPMAATS